MAASNVPSSSASTDDTAVRTRVVTNPWRKVARLSRTASTSRPSGRLGSVAVDRRRGRLRGGHLAGGVLPGLQPAAVLLDLLQGVVDKGPELGVVLLEPDAVGLLGERLADQFEGLLVLADEPQQDDVVGGHGLDLAVLEGFGALGVDVELGQVGLGVVLADVLGRGRAGHRADLLAGEVFGPADALGVALGDHDVLAGLVVRPGEVDDLLALVVDGVGGDHEVDLALLDERLAVGRDGLDPGDVVGRDAHLAGDQLGDLDVEALRLALEVLEAEQGLVELGPHGHLAGGVEPGHGGALGEAGPLVGGAAILVVAAVTGGQDQGQGQRHPQQAGRPSCTHRASLLAWAVSAARQWLMILDRKSLARSVRGLAKNSSGGAASRIRPPSMNTTRLAAERAKPISWLMTIMVMPAAARSRMTSRTSLIISGSRAEVGSSNSSSLGSMARARAMATRCCWPPDSWAGSLSAWFSTPTRASSSRARRSASCRDWPRTLVGPRVTLSSTLRCANRLNCWKTMPTSERSRASSRPSEGRGGPSRRMVPPSIGSSRLMVRHRVDLPDPEGPTTITTSPGSTSRSTSWSTCRSPNHLLTRSIWSRGEPAAIPRPPTVSKGPTARDVRYQTTVWSRRR